MRLILKLMNVFLLILSEPYYKKSVINNAAIGEQNGIPYKISNSPDKQYNSPARLDE